MKELHLIRHAKSESSAEYAQDIERPLCDKGRRDAQLIASRLVDSGIRIDLLCTSPAVRARTTAAVMTDVLAQSYEIRVEEVLYSEGEAAIHEFIKTVDDRITSLAIVSHNPDMTRLANLLGDKRIESMPTCSVISIEFDTVSWSKIEIGSGRNTRFEYPKKPNR